jgi:hypothetical protein
MRRAPLSGRRKMSFKKGTAAATERSRIAEGIQREHPGMPMGKKMAIATAAVKKEKRGGRGRRR